MTPIPPVVRSVVVPWKADAAFRRFTEDIGTWWPRSTHSIGQQEAEKVTFETRIGGRIYETIRGGRECVWGTVVSWEPPRRVVFTWHPGEKPDTAQTVELRFADEREGTKVELTHTGWERLGAKEGAKRRRAYGLGWAGVLRIYEGRGWGPYWPLIALQKVIVGAQRLLKKPAPAGQAI